MFALDFIFKGCLSGKRIVINSSLLLKNVGETVLKFDGECVFSPISMDSKASCLPDLQGESKILETFIVYEDMGSCKPDLQLHNLIVSFT